MKTKTLFRSLLLMLVTVVTVTIWILFAASELDSSKLIGHWARTDGSYVLELSSPAQDGQLKALYFNPRSINVSRAEWKQQDGVLGVFVELRDEGYPGSTYTLAYQPEKDQLMGTYFQAVIGQHFEVTFKKKK